MSHTALSLIISCEYDLQSDTTQVSIVRVDTLNGRATAQRCLIRHIASGREAYMQVGPGLRDFIKDCLLNASESSGHA